MLNAGLDGARETETGRPDHRGPERFGERRDLVVVADDRHRQVLARPNDAGGELAREEASAHRRKHAREPKLRDVERFHWDEQYPHIVHATGAR